MSNIIQPIFSVLSCQELSFGIQFDVLTLKVNFDLICPLAPPGGVLAKLKPENRLPRCRFPMDQLLESIFRQFKFFQKFPFSGFYPKNWDFVDLEWPRVRSQDIQLSYHWRIKCWQGIMADLIWLTSDMSEKGQFFLSTRNYDSHQGNRMKNLSTPFDRKSNLKIINIFGREILNSGSGLKTLSKTHRPKTGVAARWELRLYYNGITQTE